MCPTNWRTNISGNSDMAYYIGLDLGGTFLKAGLVDEAGSILSKISVSSKAEVGPEALAGVMVETSRKLAGDHGIEISKVQGVGIGAPGMMDYDAGVICAAPNLKGVKNTPIVEMVSKPLGVPAILENDANVAAFGEFWAGAAKGSAIQHMVMLTLGTGIGSGIIINGKLLHGGFNFGGEGGHIIVQPGGRLCGCGQHGCVEAYSSASNTAVRATERLESTPDASSLRDVLAAKKQITSEDVFDAAKAGDAVAMEIVDETTRYLALACVSICSILDPQVIVLGGGMIAAGDILFEKVRRHFKDSRWTLLPAEVKIEQAQLGNDAGLIGAAAVACQQFGG